MNLYGRFVRVVLFLLLGLAVATLVAGCGGLGRAMTPEEQLYVAGGTLLALGDEIKAATASGVLQGEALRTVSHTYTTASGLYRKAVTLFKAGQMEDAASTRIAVLKLVDDIRRELTAAATRRP